MGRAREEKMFPIPMCESCVNKCKKYVSLVMRSSFEAKDSQLICSRYIKDKDKDKDKDKIEEIAPEKKTKGSKSTKL